jgi:hypothetical protein
MWVKISLRDLYRLKFYTEEYAIGVGSFYESKTHHKINCNIPIRVETKSGLEIIQPNCPEKLIKALENMKYADFVEIQDKYLEEKLDFHSKEIEILKRILKH